LGPGLSGSGVPSLLGGGTGVFAIARECFDNEVASQRAHGSCGSHFRGRAEGADGVSVITRLVAYVMVLSSESELSFVLKPMRQVLYWTYVLCKVAHP
jgi:hypothetical protein